MAVKHVIEPGVSRFGRLLILEPIKPGPGERSGFICLCDCGNKIKVRRSNLTAGCTKSCGCLHKEILAAGQPTHRLRRHPLYSTWKSMIGRCTKPEHPCFSYYGGRGIKVCERWLNSIQDFIQDVSERPSPSHTLDRIRNQGDYEPGNVKWSTKAEQNRNMRSNQWVTFNGETLILTDWSNRTGLNFKTLQYRISHGWSAEDALTKPASAKHRTMKKATA